jgi:hypothetical protein
MLLDGVQPDGFIFKDWGRTLRELRPQRLKEHMGFKLVALLRGRLSRPLATEYLFGDDVERDPETYSLYGRALAGEVPSGELESALSEGGVAADDREHIQELLAGLPEPRGGVGGIFILLARSSTLEELEARCPEVTAVRDAYQLALALLERGLVDAQCVAAARGDLQKTGRVAEPEILRRRAEALTRGLVTEETLSRLS